MINTQKQNLEDECLLQSIFADDKKAFNILFSKYYPLLCSYATPIVGEDDAEELIQDMMVWIWENRKSINIESSLKNYLFKSARNRCINYLEKNNKHESIHKMIYSNISIYFEEPDYCLINELSHNINIAIKKLPCHYRDALIKNRFKRKKYYEIANEEGVSVKTIDYRIQKALKLLRNELKDYL